MFKSFFLAGFECATARNASGVWIDQLAATQHDRFVDEDYRRLTRIGIHAVRDGVRWPLVDTSQGYDFSTVDPVLSAVRRHGLAVIFDLFHFGYPEGLDPFEPPFVDRFAAYCEAAARYITRRIDGPYYFTPVNEPSFFAWAAGEVGRFAPHATGRGPELKRQLCRAAIAGIDAIRAVSPEARIVNVDPVCRVVAPEGGGVSADEIARFNDGAVFESFDMIAGRLAPELGGSMRHLDIVGVNYYWTNQWEYGSASCDPLDESDPRCASLGDLLRTVHRRYGADLIVTETAHVGDRRAPWIATLADEMAALLDEGVPIRGACLYPVLGMPEWHDQSVWTRMGLWDLVERDGVLERVAYAPAVEALAAAHRTVERSRHQRRSVAAD